MAYNFPRTSCKSSKNQKDEKYETPKRFTCNNCGFSFNNKIHGGQCPNCCVKSHSIRYSEGTKDAELEELRREKQGRDNAESGWMGGY